MDELKASELDKGYGFELELNKGVEKGRQIIDVDPNVTVATTNINKIELEDP